MLLPDPIHLGLPEKFGRWRRGQDRAVLAAIDSSKRFIVQCAPTGFGKTACYVAQALLSGARTIILTSTKGLQTQLVRDFAECGLVDIRGQGNYRCKALAPDGEFYGEGIKAGEMCDAGPCHIGAKCSQKLAGCHYFDALLNIYRSKLVVSNYSYWIAQNRYSEGLGKFDLMVMDESHNAADELAAALEVNLNDFDVETILGDHLPPHTDAGLWKIWALDVAARTQNKLDWIADEIVSSMRENEGHADRELQHEQYAIKKLLNPIIEIAQMEGDWVVERSPKAVKLAPVWPGPYAEKYLFLDIPKVVLVSATIQPKSLELLHIKKGSFEFFEYPSEFPVSRRPVINIPTIRVKHSWTETDIKTWVNRIDQIIDRRLDRKGLVHCMSYERRNLILTYSRHRDIMMANDGRDTRSVVERFRQSAAPRVLVSPSLTTGWDLPGQDCEYAIIAKIPFPDTRSLITEARTKQDKDYGPYVAMQTIVQAAGRGMRSAEDRCEVLVIDSQFDWFFPKYKHFAPRWFREAVQYAATIPAPLPKL